MNKNEINILQHALGIGQSWEKESHRNYFVAGEGHHEMPLIIKLCESGLMKKRPTPGFISENDKVYSVTDKGKKIAFEQKKLNLL